MIAEFVTMLVIKYTLFLEELNVFNLNELIEEIFEVIELGLLWNTDQFAHIAFMKFFISIFDNEILELCSYSQNTSDIFSIVMILRLIFECFFDIVNQLWKGLFQILLSVFRALQNNHKHGLIDLNWTLMLFLKVFQDHLHIGS